MKNKFSFLGWIGVVGMILLFSCNNFPYSKTNRTYNTKSKDLLKLLKTNPGIQTVDSLSKAAQWVGTTNFDLRKPNFVIIHHTAQNSCEQTLQTFTLERTKVSAHYVICKDGTIHHMLNDYFRAWHGGVAKWGNNTDINSSSIGIELDNNGYEPFDSAQINSLLTVLEQLKKNYNIPVANFIGHGDIAPKRKVDPNINFPWQLLASKGYGAWFNPDSSTQLPISISVSFALAMVGYDIKDSTAALLAFKRHFRQDSTLSMNDQDRSVLAQLVYNKLQK
ncbi:MAG: N-acetylmuramoyl-L-alanine amidase [Bacteroidetes bacterium]|nr:N-acetylmuramoyl-L-alanine amidase [Bacteroidota bacterium]